MRRLNAGCELCVKVDNSFVTLPDLPGIGFEGKADLYREMRALSA
jgi:L-alanine-DL-glutamate epimerase-like enolase superfamily enzyme